VAGYTCAKYLDDVSSLDHVDGRKLVRLLTTSDFAWGLIPWAKLHPDDPKAAKDRIIREALKACRASPNAPAFQTLTESVARSIGGGHAERQAPGSQAGRPLAAMSPGAACRWAAHRLCGLYARSGSTVSAVA
jgi:hypothetical protein